MATSFRPYYPRVQNRPQQSDDVTKQVYTKQKPPTQ